MELGRSRAEASGKQSGLCSEKKTERCRMDGFAEP